MKAAKEPIYLTPKELAARWRLALSSIYRLKDARHLGYVKLDSAIRFTLADVLAYEESGYQAAIIRPTLLRRKRRRVQGVKRLRDLLAQRGV